MADLRSPIASAFRQAASGVRQRSDPSVLVVATRQAPRSGRSSGSQFGKKPPLTAVRNGEPLLLLQT